jgi:hypothetical protein
MVADLDKVEGDHLEGLAWLVGQRRRDLRSRLRVDLGTSRRTNATP